MAVTGEKVFHKSIYLMDEISTTGNIIESKIQDYKAKAPKFIETLQFELANTGTTFEEYSDLSSDLYISDMKALVVLPFGLASLLMISSDDDLRIADYFKNEYEKLKRRYPPAAKITKIRNVYGRW